MPNQLRSYPASGVFRSVTVARTTTGRITPPAMATLVQDLRTIKLSAAISPTNGYLALADIRAMKLPCSIRQLAYGT